MIQATLERDFVQGHFADLTDAAPSSFQGHLADSRDPSPSLFPDALIYTVFNLGIY